MKELLVVIWVKDDYAKETLINDILGIEILSEIEPHSRILYDPPMGKLRTVREGK